MRMFVYIIYHVKKKIAYVYIFIFFAFEKEEVLFFNKKQ